MLHSSALTSYDRLAAAGLAERIEPRLAPVTVASFRRWSEIVHPKAPKDLALSVVSVRISVKQPVRLSVYAAEAGSEL